MIGRALLVVAVAAPLAACGTEDVVVAEIDRSADAAADAGDSSPPGSTCASKLDCHPDEFCAKATCDAPTGGCELRPVFCDNDLRPTCGCDGVTYWNDCLRKRAGAAAGEPGECSVAARCSDPSGASCPVPGASCARLVPPNAPCGPDFPGACWVLPDECPSPLSGGPPMPQYRTCGPAPPSCQSACDAIRSGIPHQETFGGCR